MAAVDGAKKWAPVIAADLNLPLAGVNAVIELLLAGNTVFPSSHVTGKKKPARWMKCKLLPSKSVTPTWWRWKTAARRLWIPSRAKGKLTEELEASIRKANTKSQLEDLVSTIQAKAPNSGDDRARTRIRAARDGCI